MNRPYYDSMKQHYYDSPRSCRELKILERKALKALPKGYGLLRLNITDDDDFNLHWVNFFAVKCGVHMLKGWPSTWVHQDHIVDIKEDECTRRSFVFYHVNHFYLPKRSLEFKEGRRWSKRSRKVVCT